VGVLVIGVLGVFVKIGEGIGVKVLVGKLVNVGVGLGAMVGENSSAR
jgi:hypothetical protein